VYFLPRDILDSPSKYVPTTKLSIAQDVDSVEGARSESYIAPGGLDTNSGTFSSPWGTFDFAIDQLSPGDTLFVRGGNYDLAQTIRLQDGDGGIAGSPVNIWAFPGEKPILDFSSNPASLGSFEGGGILLVGEADWIHFKGLTIQNAKSWGLLSLSSDNIFEQLTLRYNAGTGLALRNYASNNLVLNSDAYKNFDPQGNGENADGFVAATPDLGPGNVFDGNRSWGNSDDGYDFWEAANAVTVRDSWAYENGIDIWEVGSAFAGDGGGFKLGRDSGAHLLTNVLAWGNQNQGINSNANGNGVNISNSTVYNSGRNWQFPETSSQVIAQHVLRNNVSFAGTTSDVFSTSVDDAFNTWNGVTVDASDFLSLDDTIARGSRRADGSLPTSDFLRLVTNSNLVDAGTNVGLPFNGSAPDLGAFESADADFDGNGDVDGTDFLIWQRGLVSKGQTNNELGDANLDTLVNGSDLAVWGSQFGESGSVSAITSTPEPNTLLLLCCWTMAYPLLKRWLSATFSNASYTEQFG